MAITAIKNSGGGSNGGLITLLLRGYAGGSAYGFYKKVFVKTIKPNTSININYSENGSSMQSLSLIGGQENSINKEIVFLKLSGNTASITMEIEYEEIAV